MDVKELNKSQLILLAILLSFVTSIATGITTVSLMQQAPQSVTVPINRVVQQTVEKIVPESILKTQTVVVKEEDLVVDAIAKNESAVFTITKDGFDLENKPMEIALGKGFVVSDKGVVAVDALNVPGGETYYVKNASGKFKAQFLSTQNGFSFLKIGDPIDPKDKIAFTVPVFGDLSKMKIGQKIIILGSSVTSFMYDGNKEIKINSNKMNAGAMVLDLDGEVLGLVLSGDINSFASIDLINEDLQKLNQNPKA